MGKVEYKGQGQDQAQPVQPDQKGAPSAAPQRPVQRPAPAAPPQGAQPNGFNQFWKGPEVHPSVPRQRNPSAPHAAPHVPVGRKKT